MYGHATPEFLNVPPVRVLPYSSHCPNELPASDFPLFAGELPGGVACSVTPTTACTLGGCTVEVNRGRGGRALGALRSQPGVNAPGPGGGHRSHPRSSLDAAMASGPRRPRSGPRKNLPANGHWPPGQGGIPRPPSPRAGVSGTPLVLGAALARRRFLRALGGGPWTLRSPGPGPTTPEK